MNITELKKYNPETIVTVKSYDDVIKATGINGYEATAPNRYYCQETKAMYIVVAGSLYDENHMARYNFVEDCLYPNHFLLEKNAFPLISDFKDGRLALNVFSYQGVYKYTESRNKNRTDLLIIHTKVDGERLTCLNQEQLEAFGFVRGKVNPSVFFHSIEIKDLDMLLPYKKFDNTYRKVDINALRKDLAYQGHTAETIQKSVNQHIKDNLKFGVDSLTYTGLEGIRNTYGLEWETCLGRPAASDTSDLNVKAVHDGSLRDAAGETPGGEYVSGILVGDNGLNQMYEICRVLANSCKLNSQCGYHVHIGSLDWKMDDVVFAWILGQKIEDEVFQTLPKSRRNNSYCRKLPTVLSSSDIRKLASSMNSKHSYDIIVEELYNKIYIEVAHTKSNADESIVLSRVINKNNNHPLGSKCGYNKDTQRYCWLNFVTLLFNTKGVKDSHTLEFRCHGATLNYTKSKNWLKFCLAFCKFVETNKLAILSSVTITDIINKVYPKTGKTLIDYFNERKQVFNIKDESIDYCETELIQKKKIKDIICA